MADYREAFNKLHLPGTFILKEKQKEVLDEIFEGKPEVIAILPTGYGKSLIYQVLPTILKGSVIVFSPLSAIIEEQNNYLQSTQLKSCIINTKGRCVSGIEFEEDEEILDFASSVPLLHLKSCQIIFCHPEALFCTPEGRTLLDSDRSGIKGLVIDECHKVHEWGKTFRKAFQCLKDLQAFFPGVPRLGLSATVTLEEECEIVKSLGMVKASIVRENPDRPNIYLEKVLKDSAADSYELYENIYKPLVDRLVILKSKFPVTLVYMPLEHIGNASAYCRYVFKTDLQTSLYGIICSDQDSQVKSTILDDLGTECPRFRLVFCTSVIGMGFNSPSIERVIHSRPPRNLPDYVQEIGRAGRSGQDAQATLYFCKRDIAANVPGIKSDIIGYCNEDMCLRDNLLKQFGFKNSFIVPMHKCCSYCKNICNCFECEMFRIEL